MGAISVLILFAIMITQSKAGPARLVFQRQWWAGGHRRGRPGRPAADGRPAHDLAAGRRTSCRRPARDIALLLFEDYLFAFEVVGVLLLAAVIGGLYLARRDPDMPETNRLAGPAGCRLLRLRRLTRRSR